MAEPRQDYRTPVDPEVKRILNQIGNAVGKAVPEGWGFTLFMFTYGEGGTMTWISSANREDMLKALQEFMRKQGA